MNSGAKHFSIPSQLLEPLCKPFSRQADQLLDLHEMTDAQKARNAHPGRCLRCFYDLLGAASPEKEKALQPLREWIEGHLEIAVTPQGSQPETPLEPVVALPVKLDAPDLETFCRGAMENVHKGRFVTADEVQLEVRFKADANSRAA
jgi:hypothetical protein